MRAHRRRAATAAKLRSTRYRPSPIAVALDRGGWTTDDGESLAEITRLYDVTVRLPH
ncbi:hypothetical protein [Streptomyces cavernicola]|uniref:Transcriptional regulator n=1 Tax=Streptomyces cavernicola TaxID=3043613 RepID=A0ABT6SFP9_9ACTN|nr:hypothetical protein [Streptomyces sp. B-S-A6]MDI3406734.1 hypothetical protein [Streptomyces sp. B-S-A6]